MDYKKIDALRHSSRKLVRELGILALDRELAGRVPQDCHALVEIANQPGITVSKLAELLVLSVSATSRIVQSLVKKDFIKTESALDKREKSLYLTPKGTSEVKNIDDYSNAKVQGAFQYLSEDEQDAIIKAIDTYSHALEVSRKVVSGIKILTLSTSRPLRKQIIAMVEDIQKNEFAIPITDDVNASILRAEETFYYNNSYNFWYATNEQGTVIGSIGLQKIDDKNGQLVKLFVDTRYRGKGIAQKLLETLLKAATKHGFTAIWLGAVAKVTRAHKFYTKSGFIPVTERDLPKGFSRCHLDTLFFVRK